MWKIRYALIILSIIRVAKTADIPGCNYFDTVDLKGSKRFENGSYLYNDILIPSDKIGTYDYRIMLYGAQKEVASYPRGCLCQVKSCVLLCCEPDKLIRNIAVNITLSNGKETRVNVPNELAMQLKFEISCDLLPDGQSQGQWKLFENGTLLSLSDRSELEKEEYCLIPLKISDDNYELVPHQIKPEIQTKTTLDLPSAIRIVSIFCTIITIVIYLYLPQFNSIYSKCCVCYFICLTISFLLLWIENLYRDEISSKLPCYIIGYSGYYTVMAIFLWLLVINYHLWKAFKNFGIMFKTSMQRYHIFVWSVAAVLLVITGSAEYTFQVMDYDEDSSWQPGVGLYYCWLNTQNWSAMIYFYGPILLGILINLTFSIITARHIYVEKKKNDEQWDNPESQKSLTNQADFAMFFRLFAIAGVIWVLDILSYIFEINIERVTFIFDIITSAQGVLLFFVTIWKKDVLKALYERMEQSGQKPCEQFLTSST